MGVWKPYQTLAVHCKFLEMALATLTVASAMLRLSIEHKDLYVIARVLTCIWVRIGCHVGALVLENDRAYGVFRFRVYGRSAERYV